MKNNSKKGKHQHNKSSSSSSSSSSTPQDSTNNNNNGFDDVVYTPSQLPPNATGTSGHSGDNSSSSRRRAVVRKSGRRKDPMEEASESICNIVNSRFRASLPLMAEYFLEAVNPIDTVISDLDSEGFELSYRNEEGDLENNRVCFPHPAREPNQAVSMLTEMINEAISKKKDKPKPSFFSNSNNSDNENNHSKHVDAKGDSSSSMGVKSFWKPPGAFGFFLFGMMHVLYFLAFHDMTPLPFLRYLVPYFGGYRGLQVIFYLACVAHASEASYAVHLCRKNRFTTLHTTLWFLSVGACGFASLGTLVKSLSKKGKS